jgi:hypothetical protein
LLLTLAGAVLSLFDKRRMRTRLLVWFSGVMACHTRLFAMSPRNPRIAPFTRSVRRRAAVSLSLNPILLGRTLVNVKLGELKRESHARWFGPKRRSVPGTGAWNGSQLSAPLPPWIHALISGETPDISQYCKIGFWQWVMFRDNTAHWPEPPLSLGKYLEPSIDVGGSLCATILKGNAEWVDHTTFRALTTAELMDANLA